MPAISSILSLCLRCYSLLLVTTVLASPSPAQSAAPPVQPYATLDRTTVTYRGPGRAAEKDLPSDVATIGMIVPLHGNREAEGKALLAAAQLAIEDEQGAGPLPDGRRLALSVRDDSGPWGQASTEILRLIEEDHALAIITSENGNIAHQAEQLANKISFPILTLSSDPTTTQINIPWIFRLGPSDADQAFAFTRSIYAQQGLRRVLLLVETDHDGRIGSREFEKASQALAAPAPDRVEFDPSSPQMELLLAQISVKKPQAIVLWTNPQFAAQFLPQVRDVVPSAAVYLCRNAAQFAGEDRSDAQAGNSIRTVTTNSSPADAARHTFEQRYLSRTGEVPGLAAIEAYDAVHLLASALRAVGANRVLLRDRLASGTAFHGLSGPISFDSAGNLGGDGAIVKLAAVTAHPTAF